MSLRKSNFSGASPSYTGVLAGSSVAVTSIHPAALSSRLCGSRDVHPDTTRLSNSVRAKPATPMIVSATVHVFSVCCTVMLKNSLMSQNPESFTCDRSEEHTSELQSHSDL